jgi:putative amide transporter protein
LYCTVAYALLTGLQDLRSVGNVSLVVAIISAIYMIIFYVGGTTTENKILVARSDYFAFACLGYTVLTVEVWLNSYGKLRASILAWSLILWTPIGLWIPAFMLMAKGTLPF